MVRSKTSCCNILFLSMLKYTCVYTTRSLLPKINVIHYFQVITTTQFNRQLSGCRWAVGELFWCHKWHVFILIPIFWGQIITLKLSRLFIYFSWWYGRFVPLSFRVGFYFMAVVWWSHLLVMDNIYPPLIMNHNLWSKANSIRHFCCLETCINMIFIVLTS